MTDTTLDQELGQAAPPPDITKPRPRGRPRKHPRPEPPAQPAPTPEVKPELVPMSGFVGGKIRFLHKYAEAIHHPLGSTRVHSIPGPDGLPRAVVDPRPAVEFHGHRYQTKDPEMARAMVEADQCEQSQWGYVIDTACIPEDSRNSFALMNRESKKQFTINLILGNTGDDLWDGIDYAEFAAEQGQKRVKITAGSLICEFCHGTIPATSKDPNNDLRAHQMVMHADELKAKQEGRS